MTENGICTTCCESPLESGEFLTCKQCKNDYENSKCICLNGFSLGQKVRYIGKSTHAGRDHMKHEMDGNEKIWIIGLLLMDKTDNTNHAAEITSYHPTSGGSMTTLVSLSNIESL